MDEAADGAEDAVATQDGGAEAAATPVTGVLFDYTYGVQLVESGLYEEAIPQLNVVIKRLPDLAKGWYYRGIAYRHEEQFEYALEDLSKAIELKPEFGQAYKERGILYREMGEAVKAKEDFRTALSLYHPTRDSRDLVETSSLLDELDGSP